MEPIDITFDIETNNLLNEQSVDYNASPYCLKDTFDMHCIVIEEHQTGNIIAFYNGETYELDGREYEEEVGGYTYYLKGYDPVEYTHYQLDDFPDYISNNKIGKVIGHNIINFDLLVLKLWWGMTYEIELDKWCGRRVQFEDTMITAKTLNPDRFGGASLDNIAKMAGKAQKIQFRKHMRQEDRFKHFAADMLYYNIFDVKSNTDVYKYLEWEKGEWDWKAAIQLEKAVADIITRQEHRGFWFDKELAESNIRELDSLMEERRLRVEPHLPPRPATKKFMSEHTPPASQIKIEAIEAPKKQFNKDRSPSASLVKFADKVGCRLVECATGWVLVEGDIEHPLPLSLEVPFRETRSIATHMQTFIDKHNAKVNKELTKIKVYGKVYDLPMEREPIKTEMVATVEDTTHIKQMLVGMGWQPEEYKMKDIMVKSGTKIQRTKEELDKAIDSYVEETLNSEFKRDRLAHLKANSKNVKLKLMQAVSKRKSLKVLTNPSFTVGQEKEIDPALMHLESKFPYVKDIVEYLTYRHRRNSILGGGLEWDGDEEAEKGFLASYREDGRIPTPADTCGTACVVADTLVISDKGNVPIVEINKGDLVLTHNGVYGKVLDKVVNGIKPVAEITFDNGNSVVSTLNHPYLTIEGWKRLDELIEGEEVYTYQEQEAWRQIDTLSNYYISSWGRVLSNCGNYIKLLPRKALWDRANVDLIDDNGDKHRYGIGRLVLEAYIGKPQLNYECCHKDGNPTNNFLNNLYWGTSKENSADAKIHGRALKASRSSGKLSQEQVNEIKEYFLHNGHKRGDDGKIALTYGVSREYIRDIRLNKRWREGNTTNLYKENYTLTKVKSIVLKGEQPTFDITVEDHHSYIANGIVCHNTSRVKHKVVANIPRVTSLFGENMRGMFGVDIGFLQVGYDFDSLEARVEANYCWEHDNTINKDYCMSLMKPKPDDCHSVLARKISEVLGREFGRTPAKSVRYGCAYGAQAAKVAKTIGCDLKDGTLVFNIFWEVAKPLDRFKTEITEEWKVVGGKKFIVGLDGRKVPTRAEHAIINSKFQSAGVICAKYTMVVHDRLIRKEGLLVDFFMEDWRNKSFCQQIINYHDEAQLEENKENFTFKSFNSKEEALQFTQGDDKVWSEPFQTNSDKWFVGYSRASELISIAVDKTTKHFNLNVPLSAGYIIGKNWKDCH